jgi:hypothetical protein
MNGNGGKSGARSRGWKNRNSGSHDADWKENGEDYGNTQNGGRNEPGKRERNGENNKKPPENNRKPFAQNQNAAPSRDKKGRYFYDRPKWVSVQKPDEPIPTLTCSLCNKPITDVASAICDRRDDQVFHFDCILAQLKQHETLGEGDSLAYIGGGRFGIVHYESQKKFTIKKIIEWDQREERVHWRKVVADHFSGT